MARRIAIISLVVVLVLLSLLLGAGWYFSGVLVDGLRVDRGPVEFEETVLAAERGTLTLQMAEDPAADQSLQVRTGVEVADGSYLLVGPAAEVSGREVTRPVLDRWGPLPQPGEMARIDSYAFPDDPKRGLDLRFSEVSIPTPLGPAPAWFVPAPGSNPTWVIYSHGRADSPAQGLRMLRTFHDEGYPTVLATRRDDEGAPAEDGLDNMGLTEWEDVEATVQWALDSGARRVLLAATSAGGAASMAFLERSPLAERVDGLILDAPVLSLQATIETGAEETGLPVVGWPVPDVLVDIGIWFTEQRAEVDVAATDFVARADTLTVPMTLIHGVPDATNPYEASEAFAAAAPDGLVRLETFDTAEHTWAWNDETARYGRILRQSLQQMTG